MAKRRVHRILVDSSIPSQAYITDAIHEELVDGFCFQVNYTSSGVQNIDIKLQGSVDYDLVTVGDENWTTLQTKTCTAPSDVVIFNMSEIYLPYYRIVVNVNTGSPYSRLQIFEYSRESV